MSAEEKPEATLDARAELDVFRQLARIENEDEDPDAMIAHVLDRAGRRARLLRALSLEAASAHALLVGLRSSARRNYPTE